MILLLLILAVLALIAAANAIEPEENLRTIPVESEDRNPDSAR